MLHNNGSLLEFIYTDHSPIEETDPIGILILANQFSLTRLISLCEIVISKMIEKGTEVSVEKAEINVIEILLCAQMHNAKQLEKFCLHFTSVNYQPMKKRKEFELLDGDNLKHVTKHQWPPTSYLEELTKYEKAIKEQDGSSKMGDKKCIIM